MKKIFNISMFFAAAAIAFASCSKEETTVNTKPELSGETKTITITSAIAETRTQLSADHKITWADGDTYGIIFADADYNIVGHTTSPEYVSGQSDYTLEGVPAETKYLCCYYPANLITSYEVGLIKSLSDVDIDLPRGEFADVNVMLSKGEVTDDNTVAISFEQVVTILEVNVYDSDTSGNDYYYGVTVKASEAFVGAAKYDFTSDSATLTGFSEKEKTLYKANKVDSNKVSKTKENGSKFYFAVGKGTYSELEISATINENGEYDYKTAVVKFPSADLSQYAGYTINIDLASAEEPEVEEPLFSAPTADDEGGYADIIEISTSDYDFDGDYLSVPQYRLTMRDTDSVTFETAPENATIKTVCYEDDFFDEVLETEAEFTLVDGTLTITNFDEIRGVFRMYVYADGDESNPVAVITIIYTHTSNGDDGGDDNGEGDEDALLKLAPGSSATLRPTTSDDEWYVNDGAATEQFTVTTSSRYLYFSKFIEYKSFELAEKDATTYDGYFSSFTSQVPEGQTAFDILGNHYSETSAEYTVYFSDQWDIYVRLHIIYTAE